MIVGFGKIKMEYNPLILAFWTKVGPNTKVHSPGQYLKYLKGLGLLVVF